MNADGFNINGSPIISENLGNIKFGTQDCDCVIVVVDDEPVLILNPNCSTGASQL